MQSCLVDTTIKQDKNPQGRSYSYKIAFYLFICLFLHFKSPFINGMDLSIFQFENMLLWSKPYLIKNNIILTTWHDSEIELYVRNQFREWKVSHSLELKGSSAENVRAWLVVEFVCFLWVKTDRCLESYAREVKHIPKHRRVQCWTWRSVRYMHPADNVPSTGSFLLSPLKS